MKDCWISPGGHIIGLVGDHYNTVYRKMDSFELTGSHFESAKRKNPKDVVGEIINLLLSRGWIKISFKENKYLLEFDKWSLRHRGNFRKWMLGKDDKFKVEMVSKDGKYKKVLKSRFEI